MRKFYNAILKEKFNKHLKQYRFENDKTFEELSETLVMDQRSLYEINSGKHNCSGLTLALFLIYCCKNPLEFLQELRCAFEERAYNDIAKDAISYRNKMPIKENVLYEKDAGLYALCPRCKGHIDREYIKYCGCCGQRLSWDKWEKSPIVNLSEPEKVNN